MLSSSIPEFLHQEHRDWLQKIDFYQDQINIFQKELSYVLHQHTELFSILEHVDEYRNILLKKLKKLDEIRRQIILHERVLAQHIKKGRIDLWDHEEVKSQMNTFEKEFEALKINFRKYVAGKI